MGNEINSAGNYFYSGPIGRIAKNIDLNWRYDEFDWYSEMWFNHYQKVVPTHRVQN